MNVSIRPLEEKDAYVSYKWRNDPDVFKYTGNVYDHIITLEDELNWIRKVVDNKNDYRCAIIADGNYVGNIYLTDINESSAEYHIFIGDKRAWGKGVAKQASILILKYAFNNLGLSYVRLSVRPKNDRAMNLYNKLGFNIISKDKEFYTMLLNQSQFKDVDIVRVRENRGGGNTLSINDLLLQFEKSKIFLPVDDIWLYADKLINKAVIFEAWVDTELAGCCACYMNNPQGRAAYISYIGVNECYKRIGIGTKLINRVEYVAISNRFNSIELEVYKNNLSALSFYSKHGFVSIEDRSDRLLMRKLIDSVNLLS